jgi:para-nitrobenzyl esterase
MITKNSMKTYAMSVVAAAISVAGACGQERVTIANGTLEGTLEASGIRSFKGIPFAQPPIGERRWKPPLSPKNWEGVRKADKFGPRAMQRPVFGDMGFRSDGMSEDCLYLNVWTPAKSGEAKLPVLVYFFGGGYVAGDGSESRYDGENMAKKGIVTLTVNQRLGVFGFFAHPELSKESPHRASGNYGLLDQCAALQWVKQNIAAFGGDPKKVTIAGESAGSISVSAVMASPLSKDLIAGAIGESGSIIGALSAVPLAAGEQTGVKFAASLGLGEAPSIEALRAMSAEKLLEATGKPGAPWLTPTVDGYFFPKEPREIFAAGEQAHVPLLAGSNSEEMNSAMILGREKPTVEHYRQTLERLYPGKGEEVFKLYPATNEKEVLDAAQDLAGDRFIGYSTWKWIDLATKSGKQPTYYYLYTHVRPPMRSDMGDAVPGLAGGVVRDAKAAARPPQARGAVHSAEIEYAMGNLDSNKVYAWTPEDYKVSKTMQEYFANFIKTGNPNGGDLPQWPQFNQGRRLIIDVDTRAEEDKTRARYEFLDPFFMKK